MWHSGRHLGAIEKLTAELLCVWPVTDVRLEVGLGMQSTVQRRERVQVSHKHERPCSFHGHSLDDGASFVCALAAVVRVQVRHSESHLEHVRAEQAVRKGPPLICHQ